METNKKQTKTEGKTSQLNDLELLKLRISKVVSDPEEYCKVIAILEESK